MAIVLYGIPNCDQVKKARNWLAAHAIPFEFHDFKKNGIDRLMIAAWLEHAAWETLLNKKGTTWRALPEQQKAAITDVQSAMELMLNAPSIIKRPVLAAHQTILVGFSEPLYQQTFTE